MGEGFMDGMGWRSLVFHPLSKEGGPWFFIGGVRVDDLIERRRETKSGLF